MNNITVDFIDVYNQRYSTVGDYYTIDEVDVFKIAKCDKEEYQLLILLHELFENFQVQRDGIAEKDIYDFDVQFEHDRKLGLYSETEEPGDNKNAPYRKAHKLSTKLEKYAAKLLNIDWDEYDKSLNNL